MTQLTPKSPEHNGQSSDRDRAEPPPPQPPPPSHHRSPLILGGLALAAAAIAGTWYILSRPSGDRPIELSGRIEGYETDIGAKVPGRVESIPVREGEKVTAGSAIVQLDDDEIQAQLREAEAKIDAAKQRQRQAQLQINVLNDRLREATLSLQQSRQNTRGRVSQSEANVASAEAELQRALATLQETRSQLELAKTDRDRFATLLDGGAISQQQFDRAQTNMDTLQDLLAARQAEVEAARRKVNAAQGELEQAQTTTLNPEIRQTQIRALQTQLEQAMSQLEAARSDVKQTQAAKEAIAAKINDLKIVAPIDGIVLDRVAEPGEVVAAGQPLLSLIDLNDVYLRGYIPEGQIGRVRVGQPANVYLDSFPDRPLDAEVCAIDTEASFTPENIYFRQDRVKQAFGLKLCLDNADGFAKPGMPADAEIIVNSDSEE